MKKVLCEKNHYYDADRYDACPHCARARAFLEKTAQQPQGGALPPEADTEAEAYWSMEQLRGRRAVQPEAAAYEAPAGEAASGAPDMRTMAMLEPELTSVRINCRRMGVLCVERLRALLAGEECPPVTTVPTELHIRGTT